MSILTLLFQMKNITYGVVFHLVTQNVQFCQIVENIDFSWKDFWKYDHCIRMHFVMTEWNRWRPFFSFNPFPKSFLNIWDYWPIISPILYFALTFFLVSITREESILAKMFGLQYMLGVPPSGVYITGTYVVGIYALLYCAVSTICEDEIENKRARE